MEKNPEESKQKEKKIISYGVGMAINFFEGYLAYILPNYGVPNLPGIEENINIYEAQNGVILPVKKIFIIITKSLHSFPNLENYNTKSKTKWPYLEAVKSLEKHVRDIAGVKDRVYMNSVYAIHRPNNAPVYLVAECATPLLTLYNIKRKRYMYEELADADFDAIVEDFCRTLENALRNSLECRGRCVLVHFDDTDETKNLAEVLLAKIEEQSPEFDQLVSDFNNVKC